MIASTLPATMRARPMTAADAVRWAEVLAAGEEVDRRGTHYSTTDCAEELADPELDLARDSIIVHDGERPAACQVLWVRGAGDDRTVHADGMVHPVYRRRGIGAALVTTARQRAGELGAGLRIQATGSVRGQAALLEAAGLEPVRWWSQLHRDLTEPVAPAPLPAGLEVHRLGPDYDAARWDAALGTARNACFADHWGSGPESVEAFAHRRTAASCFRPACSVAATTPDGVVAGFVMAAEFDAQTAQNGVRDLYVDTVGTLPGWRGRGLAGALLARVLGWARESGYASSTLAVDAANPTGALAVHARAGYRLRRRDVTFAAPPR